METVLILLDAPFYKSKIPNEWNNNRQIKKSVDLRQIYEETSRDFHAAHGATFWASGVPIDHWDLIEKNSRTCLEHKKSSFIFNPSRWTILDWGPGTYGRPQEIHLANFSHSNLKHNLGSNWAYLHLQRLVINKFNHAVLFKIL